MPTLLGLDLGTSTLTALALDADSGRIVGCVTRPNSADVTTPADRREGRSEWDAKAIVGLAGECLRELSASLAGHELAGLGVTGQQHGVVLIDDGGAPLTPLINWQDRRAHEAMPGATHSYVRAARERAGEAAVGRAGCRLSAGYMAVTLFWLREQGQLPASATACFLMDYATSRFTGQRPVTDPTCAASSGAFDVERGEWDAQTLAALRLPHSLFPRIVASGTRVGGLTPGIASATGLPAGLPVFVGVGDNQASFLGSVTDRAASVLVNVGTGGQVAVWSPRFLVDRLVETRPFFDGYLIVAAGLSGGAAYAAMERFFRDVGRQALGVEAEGDVYARMNELAADVPSGTDGLMCEPFFSGTRAEPWLRGSFTGVTLKTLTPGHFARALLEGMAKTFAASHGRIATLCGRMPTTLVGAGNGVRANPLLASIIADSFALPMRVPAHREEAAYGAALLAGVGAGVIADLDAAGRLGEKASRGA